MRVRSHEHFADFLLVKITHDSLAEPLNVLVFHGCLVEVGPGPHLLEQGISCLFEEPSVAHSESADLTCAVVVLLPTRNVARARHLVVLSPYSLLRFGPAAAYSHHSLRAHFPIFSLCKLKLGLSLVKAQARFSHRCFGGKTDKTHASFLGLMFLVAIDLLLGNERLLKLLVSDTLQVDLTSYIIII